MATKKINTDLQLTAKLLDGSGSAGTSGQILSSTGTATDWISLSEISGVDGTGTANYVTKWSDADTITNSVIYDNGTNVGIGTTSPSEKFHVEGTSFFGGDMHFGSAVSGLVYKPVESGSAIDRYFLMFDETNNASYPFLTNRTPSGAVVIKTGTASGGGENEHFRIEGGDGTVNAYFTNANVGIGTTSPDAVFEVKTIDSNRYVRFKAPNGEERFQFYTGGTGNPAAQYMYDADGTTRTVQISADGTSYFNGGNVGIGTTSPLDKLSVEGNSSNLLKIRNTTNGGGASIEFNDNSTSEGTQNGTVTYYHGDSASQGGGASFWFEAEPDTVLVVGNSTNTGRIVVSSAGNNSEVDYGFRDDVNTGMLRTSADNVSLVAGGVRGIGVGTTAVSLKYAGSTKLATTSTGVTVTGVVTATGGTSTEWNTAYDNSITSAAVTGTTTKTLTLTQQDAGTVTATWTDETGSGVDGTGTASYVPRWSDSNTIEDSVIYNSGTWVGIGTASPGSVLEVFGGNAIIDYMTAGRGYGTGTTNTSFGYQVYGTASGTNTDNTVFGYRTLYAANGAVRNTAVGKEALRSLTSGDDNTAVGSQANYSLTVGGSNVAIGQTAGFSNTGGSYNVAIGRSAGHGNLSSSCIAIGYNSLQGANSASGTIAIGVQALQDQTSGAWNIGIGYSALANNTTGLANLALGYNALLNNVTGSYNLAIGTFALQNCTGSYNFGIGYQSLNTVTTGERNTGFGFRTLRYTTGSDNLAIGYQSGAAITTGTHNIAIGSSALPNFTTGSKNVGIGYFSGGSYTTNENSTYIGYNSKGSANGNTNETVIGYSATGNGSNSITLGNVAVVKTIIPAGDVGIGVTSPSEKLTVSDTSGTIAGFYATSAAAAVRIEATGSVGSAALELESAGTAYDTYIRSDRSIWITTLNGLGTRFKFEDDGDFHADGDVIAYSTTTSDARLKDDVKPIENAIDKVKAINGVEYTWNAGGRKGQKDLGVIAQNVEEVIPEIVRQKKMDLMDGQVYKTVDYDKLTALLIEAVKEQQKQIEELKAQINGLSK